MKFGMYLLLLLTGLWLCCASAPARAEWLDAHIKPDPNMSYERIFQVKTKKVGRWQECEVVITPHAGAKELRPLEFSQGRVYRSPDKTWKEKDPSPDGRGIPVPAIAKWSKTVLTVTFRVPVGRYDWIRFEYWDSLAQAPGELAGGTHYWFNLSEVEPTKQKSAP